MTTIDAPTKEQMQEAWFDDGGDEFDQVHRESDDDWRHGSSIMEVWKRHSDGTYWRLWYRKSGDGEYNGMRENEFELDQVFPQEVVTTKWVTQQK